MEEKILKLLGRKRYLPSNVPELLKGLKLQPGDQQRLQESLKELERGGQIARIKGNRYILPKEADLVAGRIQITRGGRGFLMPDEPGAAEIAIPTSGTGTALNDDRVLVRLDVKPQGRRTKSDKADSGTVVRILERRRTQIVGTLKKGRQYLYVVPDDPRMNHDINVPPAKDVGREARVGDKVVVELKEWESRHTSPEGIITEVLGPPTAEGVDMLAVLRNYDLPLKFPPQVLDEVKNIGDKVRESEVAGRKDCRSHDVISIDPADARDFDDAFFLTPAGRDRWTLWVHIADVSHYVKPGSALDREAKKRGNSTYLVDRVIPMLPEALSNELCSLKPHVDRLSKCVEFLINNDGKVLKAQFHEAVIHSKRRYSYEEAFEVLGRKPKDEIENMLVNAGELAMKIRKRRFANGALDLDFPETKIRLDEDGKVKRIEKIDNDISHQLIEEFMLLANEAVATRLIKLRRPSIHRVHERPDPKRLYDYRQEVLSHNLPCGNLEKAAEVQKLLKRLGSIAIGAALKIGFLKSLMRARYAVEPLGHYGLAKEKYAHFTSPIRRYADLIVHRTLFEKAKSSVTELTRIAEHISTTERNSADAERDSKDVKMYAYLLEQINAGAPQQYKALVTDIRNFGLFIDIPDLGMRGLVPLSRIEDDFYEFDPTRVQVIGRRSNRVIRLGDELDVEVDKVDTFKKEVDFRLVSKGGGRGGGGKGGRSSGGQRRSSRGKSDGRDDRRSGSGSKRRSSEPTGNSGDSGRSGSSRPDGDKPKPRRSRKSRKPQAGGGSGSQGSASNSPKGVKGPKGDSSSAPSKKRRSSNSRRRRSQSRKKPE
ncbi:ribonuclease R [Verrucomicrobiales bacterium BCK34]|nr:ribonuclease R [Verrucomicrobiales bacterium BCK34]